MHGDRSSVPELLPEIRTQVAASCASAYEVYVLLRLCHCWNDAIAAEEERVWEAVTRRRFNTCSPRRLEYLSRTAREPISFHVREFTESTSPSWSVLYSRCLLDERTRDQQARAQACSSTAPCRPGTVAKCGVCNERVKAWDDAHKFWSEGWWCDGGCQRAFTADAALYACTTAGDCNWGACVLCVDPYLVSIRPRPRRNVRGQSGPKVKNYAIPHLDHVMTHPGADDLTWQMGLNPLPDVDEPADGGNAP
jgi:hypothetical protein